MGVGERIQMQSIKKKNCNVIYLISLSSSIVRSSLANMSRAVAIRKTIGPQPLTLII